MATVTFQQSHAELILELANLLRQRRLADVDLGCGAPEVQLVGDGDEVAQSAYVQVHNSPSLFDPRGLERILACKYAVSVIDLGWI
ncbi:hypothetical protein ABZ412_03905 [Nocardia sp. NPDC005746]|uniref:hypothetical protein n=1 Tax=Nocardia sp. NPDC005746 TaxID=3157062 RepID=UPI0033C1C363